MRGSSASARASAVRWRWPPESITPRSPTIVSQPSGRSRTSFASCARSAAACTCARVRLGQAVGDVVGEREREQEGVLRDHRDVRAQRARAGCGSRRRRRGRPCRRPPRRGAGSARRGWSCPEPTGPTMPSTLPAGTRSETSRERGLAALRARIAEGEVAQLDLAATARAPAAPRRGRRWPAPAQHLVDALHRGGAALHQREHPAHDEDREGELDDVHREGEELGVAHLAALDLGEADARTRTKMPSVGSRPVIAGIAPFTRTTRSWRW